LREREREREEMRRNVVGSWITHSVSQMLRVRRRLT